MAGLTLVDQPVGQCCALGDEDTAVPSNGGFIWQEGHTAHATEQEAVDETLMILDLYAEFARDTLAVPVVTGRKSARERFAGAVETYTIEAMQNSWALQAGTSHFLGQNFATAFDVTFQNKEGERELVWATSWGVSTRLIGAVIMTHSDDDGLVLPPAVAPVQVVIIPVCKEKDRETVFAAVDTIFEQLKPRFRVKVDDRLSMRPGAKYFEWERKGVPLRLEVGPRDVAKGQAFAKKRIGDGKFGIPFDGIADSVEEVLASMQQELLERATRLRDDRTYTVKSWDEFCTKIESQPGFYEIPWGGDDADEDWVKQETRATIRCFPTNASAVDGQTCPLTGKPAHTMAIFARAY